MDIKENKSSINPEKTARQLRKVRASSPAAVDIGLTTCDKHYSNYNNITIHVPLHLIMYVRISSGNC